MDLNGFKNWAVSQGSVAKTNGQYAGECVSLINQYLSKVYGIQAGAWGNAKDWATNGTVATYFDKVSSPQAGDIGISGATSTNPYGHIWIYLSPTQVLEQNGKVARRVSINPPLFKPIAILRKKGTPQGGQDMATDKQIDETISLLSQLVYGKPAPDSVFKDWRNLIKNNPNNSLEGLLGILKGSESNPDALKNKKPVDSKYRPVGNNSGLYEEVK